MDTGAVRDNVVGRFGDMFMWSQFSFLSDLGADNDTYSATFAGNVIGPRAVTMQVDAAGGHDNVSVVFDHGRDGATNQLVAAPSNVGMRGGDGFDGLTLTARDAEIRGVLTAQLDGGAGGDRIMTRYEGVEFHGGYSIVQSGGADSDYLTHTNQKVVFGALAAFDIAQQGDEGRNLIFALNHGLVVQGPAVLTRVPILRSRSAEGGAGNDLVTVIDQRFQLEGPVNTTIAGDVGHDFVASASINGRINARNSLRISGGDGADYGILHENNVTETAARSTGIDMGGGSDGLLVHTNEAFRVASRADVRDPILRRNLRLVQIMAHRERVDLNDATPVKPVPVEPAQASAAPTSVINPLGSDEAATLERVDLIDDIEPGPVPIPIPIPIPIPTPQLRTTINVNMGAGHDRVTAAIRGVRSTALTIDGGADNDFVRATLSLAPPTGSLADSVRASVLGRSGNDNLSLRVFPALIPGPVPVPLPTPIEATAVDDTDVDVLIAVPPVSFPIPYLIDGGAGIDTCAATLNVTVINCEG